METNLIFLNVLTRASIDEGVVKADELVLAIKSRGIEKVGICDNSFFEYFNFFDRAMAKGIQPYFGFRIKENELEYLIYPKNETGYQTLMAYLNHKLSLSDLFQSEDINVILSLFQEVFFSSFEENIDNFKHLIKSNTVEIKNPYFGIENYLGDNSYLVFVRQYAHEQKITTLAIPKVRYLKPKEAFSLEIINAIHLVEIMNESSKDGPYYLLSEAEIIERYTEQEIKNTSLFVKTISFNLNYKRGAMYHYEDDDAVLKEKCYHSLKILDLEKEEYFRRLEHELLIIKNASFSSYFLIVEDLVRYAKDNHILVGPGRGSAAGSLVSYLLNITTIDPLQFGLLFERFLNPSRRGYPDIDIDVMDNRREEIIEYLRKRYPNNQVGLIITIASFLAKSALRDIGKVFSYEEKDISRLTNLVRNDNSLKSAYRTEPKFKQLVDEDDYYLGIVKKAQSIIDLYRQTGIHAAGIILSKDSFDQILPYTFDNEQIILRYEAIDLERQGFLKIDLLALRNLTTINNILKLIGQNSSSTIDLDHLKLDDEKTLAILNDLKTIGIFQLESAGMIKTAKKVGIKSFLDIALVIALYRPGPMDHIDDFAARKHGGKAIIYPSLDLEDILKETYGVFVYQEQVMSALSIYASFSLASADIFRRAMAKKDPVLMKQYHQEFIEGAFKKGHNKTEAEKVYAIIERFAGYGFNKSHAVAYAKIAYIMAYLKAHYPKEFYQELSLVYSLNDVKGIALINEIRDLGLSIAPPSINQVSNFLSLDFEKKIIIPPLTIINAFNEKIAEEIISSRGDSFIDIYDFFRKTANINLDASKYLALINAGYLDEFNYNRETLRHNLDNLINYASLHKNIDQSLLSFEITKPILNPYPLDLELDELLEFNLLGLTFSTTINRRISQDHQLVSLKDGQELNSFNALVLISRIKVIRTKKNEEMAFITFTDGNSELEATMFSTLYQSTVHILSKEQLYQVQLRKNRYADKETFEVVEMERLNG